MISESTSVVHLVPQLRLGAGRYVVDTALEQARAGWSVSVGVATDGTGDWRSDPRLVDELCRTGVVTIFEAGDFFHRSPSALLDTARALRKRLAPEALRGVGHAHSAMAAAVARWAGIETVVATCHGWNVGRDESCNLQDALAFGLVDAVTSPSAYWASALRRVMGIGDVAVIPVGLDLSRYSTPQAAGARARPFRIACLAELTARKGIRDLLDALPHVWSSMPDVELHLFGDGDGRVELEQRAAEIDPGRLRVVFHGFVTAPYSRIEASDLFCLPSRSDNFPVALMEAMLARLPVVATEVGGIPELVTQAGCGTLVPAAAPLALASAVLRMLALSREERLRLGKLGERFIRDRCAIEVTGRQLRELYRSAGIRRARQGSPCA